MPETTELAATRADILGRISDAAARAGRALDDIGIVAVTKTVAADRIRDAIAAGFTTLGENRVQERAAKVGAIDAVSTWPAAEAPRWHLVGPLQSNKARRAVELFDAIETVDSLELATRLGRISAELRPGRPLPILLQVNVDDDASKSGFAPERLERDMAAILDLPGLAVEGLMTVGRLVDHAELARPTFAALRQLGEGLRSRHARLGPVLSMGMSEDYAIAVEEGATLVRLGRAIFGARPSLR